MRWRSIRPKSWWRSRVTQQSGCRTSKGSASSTAFASAARRAPLRRSMSPTTGLPGDILLVNDPRQLPDLAAIHPLVDLRSFIDEATLLDDYGPHLVSLSRIGEGGVWPSTTGPIYGAIVSLNSKSLVWTKEPEFTDLGYTAPSDWASFMRLAQRMVADGPDTVLPRNQERGSRGRWMAGDGLGRSSGTSHGRRRFLRRLDRSPRAVRRSCRGERDPDDRRDGRLAGIPRHDSPAGGDPALRPTRSRTSSTSQGRA